MGGSKERIIILLMRIEDDSFIFLLLDGGNSKDLIWRHIRDMTVCSNNNNNSLGLSRRAYVWTTLWYAYPDINLDRVDMTLLATVPYHTIASRR